MRLSRLIALAFAAATPVPSAWAGPEWHAGVQPSLAVDFQKDSPRWAFDASLDADLLFGRERGGTLGYGAGLELGSWAFSDFRAVPMAKILVPVGDLDLTGAVGPLFRVGKRPQTGGAARLFLGYRAFNHTGSYGTGFGLFAGADAALDGERTTWMLGVHFDAMWASLPFIALASWVRGNPND